MRHKKFLISILVGILGVSLISWVIYSRHSTLVASQLEMASPTPSTQLTEMESPLPSAIPLQNAPQAASPKPSIKPSLKPSATPTPTPTILPDYSPTEIRVGDGYGNNPSFNQGANLNTVDVHITFQNGAPVAGSGELRLHMYQDGTLVHDDVKSTFTGKNSYSYHPTTTNGTHTIKFVLNETHSVTESNYGNNETSISYTINGDKTPPTFTIDGPYQINGQTCMRWINLQDNVSVYTDVWAKWKIDGGEWSNKTSENPYGCITGTTASSHTYSVHAEDRDGNVHEESKTFILY